MRLAYVAGPYRSKLGSWGVAQNIERARVVARELWLMGFAVICPHANTSMMDGTDTDAMFLDGDIVILERCDFIVLRPARHVIEAFRHILPDVWDDDFECECVAGRSICRPVGRLRRLIEDGVPLRCARATAPVGPLEVGK